MRNKIARRYGANGFCEVKIISLKLKIENTYLYNATLFPLLISDLEPCQAVSPLLLTATARVRHQVKSCGICGGQSGTGVDFLRVIRLYVSIIAPKCSILIYHPGLVQQIN
jgi:hypothetical protein